MPPAIDEALVEAGFKGKLGAPALNTLMHSRWRITAPSSPIRAWILP